MGTSSVRGLIELAGLDAVMEGPPPINMARQFDFAYLAALSEALEELYGARGGRGMALKIGRASFGRGLKDFGALKGVQDPAFRSLPIGDRVYLGLRAMASIYTNFSDQPTHVEPDGEHHYHCIVDNSPFAWGRTSDKPVCHALAGVIQQCLRWVSNGYEFHVQETACRATGSPTCVFRINKKPIGSS